MLDQLDVPESSALADKGQVIGVAALLRDAHRAVAKSLSAKIAPHGVSIGQWHFLRALWEEDGMTQRELSHRVGMMEPTTVTALNGMERRGLVKRVRNPRDRRKLNVYLTDAGRALKAQLLPLEEALNQEIAVLAAGTGEFDRALQAVIAGLAAKDQQA